MRSEASRINSAGLSMVLCKIIITTEELGPVSAKHDNPDRRVKNFFIYIILIKIIYKSKYYKYRLTNLSVRTLHD